MGPLVFHFEIVSEPFWVWNCVSILLSAAYEAFKFFICNLFEIFFATSIEIFLFRVGTTGLRHFVNW